MTIDPPSPISYGGAAPADSQTFPTKYTSLIQK